MVDHAGVVIVILMVLFLIVAFGMRVHNSNQCFTIVVIMPDGHKECYVAKIFDYKNKSIRSILASSPTASGDNVLLPNDARISWKFDHVADPQQSIEKLIGKKEQE